MVPVTRRQPEQRLILGSLTDDEQVVCFEEIFDYLTLKDLNAVGQTCKRLNRVAGKYFAENFKTKSIEIWPGNEKNVHKVDGYETNFGPFARHIIFSAYYMSIYRLDPTIEYRYLKIIQFTAGKFFEDEDYSCIENMDILAKVSTVIFYSCSETFCNNMLDRLLKSCPNIKSLFISHTTIYEPQRPIFNWFKQCYPTLEELGVLFEHDLSWAKLETFLRANPQIKKLSATLDRPLLRVIEATGVELDELECKHNFVGTKEKTWVRINALVQKGQIKHLKVNIDGNSIHAIQKLKDVDCPTSLSVGYINAYCQNHANEIASLVNLSKLEFDGLKIHSEDAKLFAESLPNLEEVVLGSNPLSVAMPFVRLSPKLKVIIVPKLKYNCVPYAADPDPVDVYAWNNERKKLPNARKMQIYLADEIYHQIRWRSVDMLLDMVEFRRLERFPFWVNSYFPYI